MIYFLGRFSRGRMETSLRYTCNSKSLKIHAKEKLPVNSKTHLQVKLFVSFQNLFRIGVAIKNVSLLYFNSETSSLW